MQIVMRIGLSGADRDRALRQLSREMSREIRSLNHTLAAIAMCDESPAARRYLSQIVEEGISAHDERTYKERMWERLEAIP
ncbi:hypothetical protein [Candidatus Poriferisocius sp.]|uniref:hypothetical protein n=1 Tax=Candidatus Poriferisocius sp. TaxID=3101276 RepID=UPI003B52A90D